MPCPIRWREKREQYGENQGNFSGKYNQLGMKNTLVLGYARPGRGGEALGIETLFIASAFLGLCNSAYAASIKTSK